MQNHIWREKPSYWTSYWEFPAECSGKTNWEEEGGEEKESRRCFLGTNDTSPANGTAHVFAQGPALHTSGERALLLGDADSPSFQTEMAAGKCGTADKELGENVLHKYMYI